MTTHTHTHTALVSR